MSSFRRCLIAGLLLFFVVLCFSPECRPQESYWPTNEWRTSSPEAQGIDSTTLADAFDYIRQHQLPIHSLLVVRNGYVVLDAYFYPYERGVRHDVASVTKSVISTLIGVAVAQRKLHDVHQPLLSFFPDVPVANLGSIKEKITIEDLLTMTSGLDCQFQPGEITLKQMKESADWVQFMLDRASVNERGKQFEYCSGGMHLLSGILSRTSGSNALEFAHRKLFGPLGITDATWPSDPQSVTHGWGDLQLQPRDMAKIGYLWLREGRWEDQQLVPADYMRAATSIHSRSGWGEDYGYGFWIYPQVAGGLFEANGRGGQRISVSLSKNIVVVMTGGGFEPGDVGKFLLASIKSDHAALPENRRAAGRLQSAIRLAEQPPFIPATSLPKSVPLAQEISGKIYGVEKNPWNLSEFSIEFPDHNEAIFLLKFADGHSEKRNVGLDGLPRISGVGEERVSARGTFDGANEFVISYDEIARIDSLELRLRFSHDTVLINLLERTGGDRLEFSGREVKSP